MALPNDPILVVYRSDGSGTTYNWTDYLSKLSTEWQAKVGVSTSVEWPVGVGARGSGGVVTSVAKVKGAIGYVEYSYAQRAKLAYGLVQNRAGNFVSPDAAGLRAAIEGADWAKGQDFYVLLSDSPAAQAYPIIATSFAIIHRYPKDAEATRDMMAFFRWSLEQGQDMAESMNYLPLPAPLVQQIEAYWQEAGR
jgi:phosphate transport system substrate-binding protein